VTRQNLLGGVSAGQHISEVTNASRTLLLNIRTLEWDPVLLHFFGIRESVLPRLVSTSEVYGNLAYGPLKGVPLGGLVGDQQGALIGNKCLSQGQAKCTYGTGAFLLFCTGPDIVYSNHGLLSTVREPRGISGVGVDYVSQVAYRVGPQGKPVYALEGASKLRPRCYACIVDTLLLVAVAGSAIKWLRDSMKMIKTADEVNTLAGSVSSTSGVYFVTAFSGLLAPYWDPSATGLLVGLTSYTTPAHIARATLEANAFQTRAVIESMKGDSKSELAHLKVDGGMTNGDVAMEVLADVGGFEVVRPEMRETTALGSALLAGAAIGLFGWDIARPETLARVNTARSTYFAPRLGEEERGEAWRGWLRAVKRSRGWVETVEE
jgi:glycerol kinase